MREAQRARELAAVRRKNRDTRIKHHEEVAARKAQQRSYDTALSTYKANKVRLEQEYKDAIKAAEDEYEKASREALDANCTPAALPSDDVLSLQPNHRPPPPSFYPHLSALPLVLSPRLP